MGAPTVNQFLKIPVLDHGFVRLVDSMGGDLSIVRSARVSYNAAWRAGEDEQGDARLIRYLMRNGHNTPFESVTVTLEVKAPIFVFRQWHRHRTQSYNELSARYRELPGEYYVPDPAVIGEQGTDNKQVRLISEGHASKVEPHHALSSRLIKESCQLSFETYRRLLADGVPRELARSVLPLATYSHMFTTANLHNWYRFLAERLHPHAQWEIQQYARAVLDLIAPIAPVATKAFVKYHDIDIEENT